MFGFSCNLIMKEGKCIWITTLLNTTFLFEHALSRGEICPSGTDTMWSK